MCRVRIHNMFSNCYTMRCGIHQGGYLSLIKYVAYINSLIVTLEESDLCCNIERIRTAPLGYADDVAAASVPKYKMDKILCVVDEHS